MNIRKTRTHQTGASNFAAKANQEGSKTQPGATRSCLLSTKEKRITEIISRRLDSEQSPLRKAEMFYEKSGKKLKEKPQLSMARSAHLEEKDKRKMAFTGESDLIYDKYFGKYLDVDSAYVIKPMVIQKKEMLIQEKRDLNGTAIQETQLVGYDKYSADTIKGNVNLEKVREARRILRRKYANRNNLQKIYAAWDEDSTGNISLENMYRMSGNLGLNLNVDEARVLLASANRSGTGFLTLDEFLDLIYNKDDALNVDLNTLSEQMDENYLLKREELYKGESNVIKRLQEDAKRTRENRHMNQVNLVLKNKIHPLVLGFLNADPNSVGYVSYEKFVENVKKLGINEHIVSDQDIRFLFNKFISDDQHTINYKSFIESLRNFKFNYEEMYNEFKGKKKNTTQQLTESDEEFNIIDCRAFPYEQMLDYWGKSRRVSDAIKRCFPTPNELKDHLSSSLKINREEVDKTHLSKKEFKELIENLFQTFETSYLTKRDLEGFLSAFIYNKHGYTNLQELSKNVYEETEKDYMEKIAYRKKGLPPHPKISHAHSVDEIGDLSESVFNTPEKAHQDSSAEKLLSLPDYSGKKTRFSDSEDENGLKNILQKIDNQLFIGRKKQFDLYKTFDVDQDGFISHKDFVKKIDNMSILHKEETAQLVKYLDPENKGYVNFREFSNKIRPNVVQEDSFGETNVLPYITPSKSFNQKEFSKVKQHTLKIQDVEKGYRAWGNPIQAYSRYAASPNWKNTFVNHHASFSSPMSITEAERFNRSHLHRVEFQKEAQDKKTKYENGRLESIKAYRETMDRKIEQNMAKEDQFVANSMKRKGKLQASYEQRAKLRNEFAY